MIYDCFTFFNELDLLEIRLNILDKTVDKFVLVEATKTHQGKEKPLYFNENKKRFEKFLPKIIHVIVDEYPEYEGKSAWVLEHHQRNNIMNGLKDCKPDDVILISDADEIPAPNKILEYKNKNGIKIFRQRMYYYYINCSNASNGDSYRWNGTIMLNYKDMMKPQDYRNIGIKTTILFHPKLIYKTYGYFWKLYHLDIKGIKIRFIKDGGWHFSYLGGVETIIKKLEAFAHTEYNKEKYKDAKAIEIAIEKGDDIFGREFSYHFVQLDNTFPLYILENLDKYSHLINSKNVVK
jgi:beta-1,4-mannosyl-glycoprotein beta-1,4-N-acetylglucosaminyltransferase